MTNVPVIVVLQIWTYWFSSFNYWILLVQNPSVTVEFHRFHFQGQVPCAVLEYLVNDIVPYIFEADT